MRTLEKQPLFQPILYPTIRFLSFCIFKLIWRLRIEGKENFPKMGPLIIAANHRSLADPPIVGVSVPRQVHFLAKEELFRFKPFGWLITNLNAHPLNRAGSDIAAFKMAKKILQDDKKALILFPEGRRSKTDELGKARAGVGMLAAMTGCPVIPTYIKNSAYLNKLNKVTIRFGKPLENINYPSHQAFADEVLRQIGKLAEA